jgi:hypothetical protein
MCLSFPVQPIEEAAARCFNTERPSSKSPQFELRVLIPSFSLVKGG